MQIVVFELGGERYAIETSRVQGIDKMMDITSVPCAPRHIRGLVNLRGSIISVIDPYVVLDIDSKDRQSENIVITETDDELLGIIVDRVTEVIDIDNLSVKNISVSKNDDREYIKGTINMGDYLVTLVDTGRLAGTGENSEK